MISHVLKKFKQLWENSW